MSKPGRHVWRWLLGAVLPLLAAGSCGKVATPVPAIDSNTNWLARCTADDECGGSLRCYCGMCTKPCGQSDECSLLSGAQCAQSGEGLCGEQASPGGLCALGCAQASECGAGFDCEAGRCAPTACAEPPGRSWDDVFQSVNSDLASADVDDAQFYRYLDLGAGAGDADGAAAGCGVDSSTQRQALTRLINSLSINAGVDAPVPIDAEERLYRIDLRDYDWDRSVSISGEVYADIWDAIVANNPYALPFIGEDADDASADTDALVPVMLANPFIAAATRPSVYYAALDIPEDLAGVAGQLEVELDSPSVSAGFVEEAEFLAQYWQQGAREGYLWSIADYGRAAGALLENPLLLPLGERELIFTLPNGLHAFAFMNAAGARADGWTVTPDAQAPDRVARAPLANLRRHPQRINVRDQVRGYVEGTRGPSPDLDVATARERFPGEEAVELLLASDFDRFHGRALTLLGLDPEAPEPIGLAARSFEQQVTLQAAAADLMLTPDELRDNLALLDPLLAPLDGGTIPRSSFSELYPQALCVLSTVLENQPLPDLCL